MFVSPRIPRALQHFIVLLTTFSAQCQSTLGPYSSESVTCCCLACGVSHSGFGMRVSVRFAVPYDISIYFFVQSTRNGKQCWF